MEAKISMVDSVNDTEIGTDIIYHRGSQMLACR